MKNRFFIIIFMLSSIGAAAQESEPLDISPKEILHLSIEDALKLGREESIDSKANSNTMLKAYWRYRDYRAGLLPGITLSGTLPSLNRSLKSYQQENGVYKFIPNNYLSEYMNFSIRQAIPFSGGELYIESNLERMDQLGANRTGSFLSVPFSVTLSQPLTAYNPYKWQKKTEPLRYETSRQEYTASMEDINITTVSYYFDLLVSMSKLESARQNHKNASDLYGVAQAKGKIGTISDSDLMQLKVNLLNTEASILTAENDYLEKMNILRNYLGIKAGTEIIPEIPQAKIIDGVCSDAIKEKARKNNPIYDNFKLRLIEAEANVIKAKRERMPDVNLYISVGATGSHPSLSGAYNNLENRQIAEIGISIPILDWGKRKGKYVQAKADYDLVKERIVREEDQFDEKVRILAEDFIDQQQLVKIYMEADAVAQERYTIALNRFTVGDISVTDLNYAEQEKDRARQNYISQLYLSWLYYYNLRYITLYDFAEGCDIIPEN